MRKIQPTLQSQGYENFDDLLSKSLPKISSIITVGLNNCDFTSPLEAAAASETGDLILVYPGSYDCGDQSIILKDGVNWFFFPGVTITSSSNTSVFYDNGVVISAKFFGQPTLINTTNSRYWINKQTNSDIDYEYRLPIRAIMTSTDFNIQVGKNIDIINPVLTVTNTVEKYYTISFDAPAGAKGCPVGIPGSKNIDGTLYSLQINSFPNTHIDFTFLDAGNNPLLTPDETIIHYEMVWSYRKENEVWAT